MKGTVESNIYPEVKDNMKFNIAEMNKVLKLMKSIEQGEEVELKS